MAYVYSTNWSPNYNKGTAKKLGIVVHHAATTDFYGIGRVFQNTARQTSAHYGVAPGKVEQYVHEDCTAWHAADQWANTNTIGIECVNSGGAPGWPVAEGTVDTLVELMAEIAKRHGMGKLARNKNVWGHKDFAATGCPGVLYDRLDEICARVNRILDGSAKAQQWAPHFGEHQQLVFSKTANGYVTIKSKSSGLFLECANGKAADGTAVVFAPESGEDAQKFKREWVSVGGIKYLTLRPKLDASQCVSVAGASNADGAPLCLWPYYEGKEQRWTRVPIATRTHVLISRSSHKALDCDA